MLGGLVAFAPGLVPARAAEPTFTPGRPNKPELIVADRESVQLRAGMEALVPLTFAVDGSKAFVADQVHDAIRIYRNGRFERAVATNAGVRSTSS
jgi:hypothetical protein